MVWLRTILLFSLWAGPTLAAEAPPPLPLGDGQESERFLLTPFAALDDAVAGAQLDAAAGRISQARRKLAKAAGLPPGVADMIAAHWARDAGLTRAWRKGLDAVRKADSGLAPWAAWELAEEARRKGRSKAALALYQEAATEPALCGEAYLARGDLLVAEDRPAARAELQAALDCLPDAAIRRQTVLDRLDWLDGTLPCELRLLHELYFAGEDGAARALQRHWGDEWPDVVFLRDLVEGSRSDLRRALHALKKSQKGSYEEAMLLGLVAKQRRRDEKAAALPHFEHAHRLGGSPLRRSMALYYKARTLESLDCDLEARDIYAGLVARAPDFPLARPIMLRMADIAVREGHPLLGLAGLGDYLDSACPGEDLCEALWLGGFLNTLAGNWEQAAATFEKLASGYFFKEQSRWVHLGPQALFWRGKALLAAGRRAEAVGLWHYLAHDFSGDYYGVLAGRRLEQLGELVEAPAPARLERSPLELPESLELPSGFGPAILWFRMGEWKIAFRALRARIAAGRVASGAGLLAMSAYLRANSLRDGVRFRREYGMGAAPWQQGARIWRGAAHVRFVEAMRQGRAVSGLNGAFMAAIARFESNFNPRTSSHAGAIGLLQVRPVTGSHVAVPCFGEKPVGRKELRDPVRNAILGSFYIQELVHRHHGNWAVALAAYNAGPGAASWWLTRFAGLNTDAFVEQLTYPNTVGYVKRILATVPAYWSLYYPVLEEDPLNVQLPLSIPDGVRPFLDQKGGRCDPERKSGNE